jgi:hypothetical protein
MSAYHNEDINAYTDVVDSRSVQRALDALQSVVDNPDVWGPEDVAEAAEELASLSTFKTEVESGSNEWKYGIAIVNERYMEDYAREYAEDLDGSVREAQWPFNHIDWEAATAEFTQDYSRVEWAGTDWYVR